MIVSTFAPYLLRGRTGSQFGPYKYVFTTVLTERKTKTASAPQRYAGLATPRTLGYSLTNFGRSSAIVVRSDLMLEPPLKSVGSPFKLFPTGSGILAT
jgi:hypothetical protein